MGLFNKLKRSAQDALDQVSSTTGRQSSTTPQQATAPPTGASRSSSPVVADNATTDSGGTGFEWDEEQYPFPKGWEELAMKDWFERLEAARAEMTRADEMDLPSMTDDDGDELDPEEVLLVTKYGFRSGGHFEAYRNWGVARWAAETGEDKGCLESRMGALAREGQQQQTAAAMDGLLEPIEGVSLQQWAQLQAGLGGAGDTAAILAAAGLGATKWQRVNEQWISRMRNDTTMTVSTAYAEAFAGGGQFGARAAHAANAGVGGDLADEPIPFERYVQIQEAINSGADKGQDASAVLGHFSMSPVDWSNVSMFWSKKIQQNAPHYHALYAQYAARPST